jgi:hypothetical protein
MSSNLTDETREKFYELASNNPDLLKFMDEKSLLNLYSLDRETRHELKNTMEYHSQLPINPIANKSKETYLFNRPRDYPLTEEKIKNHLKDVFLLEIKITQKLRINAGEYKTFKNTYFCITSRESVENQNNFIKIRPWNDKFGLNFLMLFDDEDRVMYNSSINLDQLLDAMQKDVFYFFNNEEYPNETILTHKKTKNNNFYTEVFGKKINVSI